MFVKNKKMERIKIPKIEVEVPKLKIDIPLIEVEISENRFLEDEIKNK